jgi:hypothetical protein
MSEQTSFVEIGLFTLVAALKCATSGSNLSGAPCRLFARNGVGHCTVAGWREESFEDLHPRGSGSGYDAVTDLLAIRRRTARKIAASETSKLLKMLVK